MKLKILSIVSLFTLSLQAKYEQKMAKDKNGYSYEYYENDPIGLRVYTLENGLKVYLSRNEIKPEIITRIAVNVGSNDDPRDNTGLAHYFEHMMFKGTSKIATSNWEKEKPLLDKIEMLFEKHKKEKDPKKKKDIYSEIDKLSFEASQYAIPGELDKLYSLIGAKQTNAYTYYDQTVYVNTIPSNELERWLAIEKERFSDIVLRVFHTELETVYEEYNMGQDNYRRYLNKTLIENTLKGSNYVQDVIGEPEHIKNPSITSIYNFAKQYYVPNNMAVILSGDLDYEKSIKLIDDSFGKLKPNKNLKLENHQKAQKLTGASLEITDKDIEKVVISFREKPKTKQSDYLYLVELLLSSKIGLLSTNISDKQILLGSMAGIMKLKDYDILNVLGSPKPGMSLEETKNILWKEIDNIKSGNFDRDIIPATLNNYKISIMNSYENNNYIETLIELFINNISWKEELGKIDELMNINVDDVIAYAKDNLTKDNCFTIYKRKGDRTNAVKVEKPKITELKINRDEKSIFFRTIEKMRVKEEIKPQVIDFSIIKTEKINDLEYNHVRNTKNDLFSLSFEYPLGTFNNKKLSLASDYVSILGTDKRTLSQIKKEFYKLGINYNISVDNEESFLSISGLAENMEKGINLFMEYINNLNSDNEKYKSMLQDIFKIREESKNNNNSIIRKMASYSIYGDNSPDRDVLSKEELESINPQDLVKMIKDFINIQCKVYYYGKDDDKVRNIVLKNIKTNAPFLSTQKKTEYVKNKAKGNIYFVDKEDMVQAQIRDIGILDIGYSPDISAYSKIYNEYFGYGLSSIVFQEIREARSLSYSASVYLQLPEKKEDKAVISSSMQTQPDKLLQANEAMENLILNMPKNEISFLNTKDRILKNIAMERVLERSIYGTRRKLLKLGYDKSNNIYIYNKLKNITINELYSFFEQNVKNSTRDILLLGNKKSIDLEKLSKQSNKKVIQLDINHIFNY